MLSLKSSYFVLRCHHRNAIARYSSYLTAQTTKLSKSNHSTLAFRQHSKSVSSCRKFTRNKKILSMQPAIINGSVEQSERGFHVASYPQQLLVVKEGNTKRSIHISSYACQEPGKEGTTSKPNDMKVDYKLHETVLNAMGANYHVSYVDEGDKNNPVILCLHGMPACHKDFLPIMPKLVEGGARVILFNFPGMIMIWCQCTTQVFLIICYGIMF